MRTRTALGAIGLAAVAAPVISLAAAVVRVHVFARRGVANVDPEGTTIVVFGAQALESGPARSLRARLDHALALYGARPHRRLALAGGVPETTDIVSGGHDEVDAMVTYALERGVSDHDIIEVRPGQNTREQVASTRRLVQEAGYGPIIGVSSSYHLARIHDEARRQGFAMNMSASPTGPDVDASRQYAVHVTVDALALIWYALPASLTRRVNTSSGSLRHGAVGVLAGRFSWSQWRRREQPQES